MENPVSCRVCQQKPVRLYAKKSGFDVYKCPACGLLFVWPLPDPDKDIAEIYSQEYFSGAKQGHGYVDYDADKQAMTGAFTRYLKKLEGLRGKRGALLDIGAATGFFIAIARERGWQVAGVEISKFAAEKGRKKGLDIRAGVLAEADFTDNSFDAVTMLDVIEHISDPETELKRIYALLRPKGLLLINNPDAGSFYAKLWGRRWHAIIPPEHLVLFNAKNLSLLLRRCGYETVYLGKVPKKFALRYIAQVAANWLKSGLLQRLAKKLGGSRLGRLAIPIPIRDNFLLIARKN